MATALTMRRPALLLLAVALQTWGCAPIPKPNLPATAPSPGPTAALPSAAPTPAPSAPLDAAPLTWSDPALAVDPVSADAAVVWTEAEGDRVSLKFQALAAGSDQPSDPVTVATGTRQMSRATVGAAGGLERFLVVWPEVGVAGPAIWGRWLDHRGSPLSESMQLSAKATVASEPEVACLAGSCLTAWWDSRNDTADVVATWVPPQVPLPSNVPVAVASGSRKVTDLWVDAARERAWMVWPESANGNVGIASLGLPPGTPPRQGVLVAAAPGTAISYPRVAVDTASGRGCVAWVQANPMVPDVKAQLMDGDGRPIGDPITLATGVKTDRPVAVLPLPKQPGFGVFWQTYRYQQVGTAFLTVPDRLVMATVSPTGQAIVPPLDLGAVDGTPAVATDGQDWLVTYRGSAGRPVVRRIPAAPLPGPQPSP